MANHDLAHAESVRKQRQDKESCNLNRIRTDRTSDR